MDWTSILLVLGYAYSINNLILLVYSLNLLILLLVSWRHWKPRVTPPPVERAEWPTVLVQLPVYNERFVVERAIHAMAALDYPRDRLRIQVLDDSTDDTSRVAEACVERYRRLGLMIEYRHRATRRGFKAGALADGLAAAPGDFVAIFDADFVPSQDFLRRLIPDFLGDPRLGLVQARWDHLNLKQNWMTRALGLGFDAYFAIEQVALSKDGLFMIFNGSAGIWRRAAIDEAGGWMSDTLVEDTDLSYRAQLRGWRFDYRPDVAVPGQLPDNILALKLQQFRWSKGAIQALRKLGAGILWSREPLLARLESIVQLSGYLAQPLMLISLLLSLPVVLLHGKAPLGWAPLGLASLVPPLVALYGQLRLRRAGQVWLAYPVLFLTGIGLSISNTQAVLEALLGHESEFKRTPKLALASDHEGAAHPASRARARARGPRRRDHRPILAEEVVDEARPPKYAFAGPWVSLGRALTVLDSSAGTDAPPARRLSGARGDRDNRKPFGILAGGRRTDYPLFRDWTVLAELAMAVYGVLTGTLALTLAPGFAPFVFLYALGFGFTAFAALVQ